MARATKSIELHFEGSRKKFAPFFWLGVEGFSPFWPSGLNWKTVDLAYGFW